MGRLSGKEQISRLKTLHKLFVLKSDGGRLNRIYKPVLKEYISTALEVIDRTSINNYIDKMCYMGMIEPHPKTDNKRKVRYYLIQSYYGDCHYNYDDIVYEVRVLEERKKDIVDESSNQEELGDSSKETYEYEMTDEEKNIIEAW
jgi:hypothetical protein